MNLTTDDLITLHTNINRQVGKEIFPSGLRAYGEKSILKSIQKLIEDDKLVIKKDVENSLNYFTVSQLRELLKNNNLPISGTKPKLIQRVKENFGSIQNIELPSYYDATDEGIFLISDTKYLMHFITSWDDISYKQAFYIAEHYIDNTCEDKILAIYDYKLSKKDNNNDLIAIYRALCDYYLNEKKDLDNSRKYLNLIYYDHLKTLINTLDSDSIYNSYYDEEDKSLKYESIKTVVKNYIKYDTFVNTYEILIIDLNYSIDELVSMFKEDISEYENELSNELIYHFISCIVAYTLEENETESVSKLYKWLKNEYPYKHTDEDYEDYEDNYDDGFMPIDIQELMKIKEDINIHIDKYDGRIILYLKEERLDTFLNENDHEY
ncbi:SAP domain-containing protein [Staphylococcus epidermidis]|uniref:SAP domain-containing protein n=1 Tax=Staphylococcus epidermidis TaxID=1282 RepID=UPI00138AB6FD|nr:SAP domain-containing protein [Staphylococcus epidermidis]MBF2232141.1 SAP domain-containing protein [Staphylococcus epidermidis]MCH9581967.1 SAP domain-containing protein [Staphylococcus epidermidis]